ncbi:MAG: hypothetical protein AB1656_04545 [Candidatus Omnitrophota bacterium]
MSDACMNCVGKSKIFKKLLKSGYRVEKQRFSNAAKTAKLLVVLTAAAMMLHHLMADLNLPSGGYLDEESYQNLKRASHDLHNPEIDLRWRLLALIAKFGGWLGRKNDPIGPTILIRGLVQVLTIFNAASLYGPLI